MCVDMIKFLLLALWMVVVFGSFFQALYAEPYDTNLNPNCVEFDPDQHFASFSSTFIFLIEATVGGDYYLP